ncbi:unnamed protein product [Didymodactylos carnosus]|uniref:Holliday junction DNA helicase RuvA C-terminal domain-containing protein n=1 Tax=Didymodactylos carnosus TaxID=1234261 RepID=A0A8S2H005_9BILA|nr:unnamed protein product [Didymodactylos carnosus]CAF3580064.1 unnamed protein product [Didymodactylos carnosus]
MLLYANVRILAKYETTILAEHNGLGYITFVADPQAFTLNRTERLYVHQFMHTDSQKGAATEVWYGFSSPDERDLFQKLIRVSGIGPKTAIQLLRAGVSRLRELIGSNNVEELALLPGMKRNLAENACAQLTVRLKTYAASQPNAVGNLEQVISALSSLGYHNEQIAQALNRIGQKPSSVEDLLALTLRELAVGKKSTMVQDAV